MVIIVQFLQVNKLHVFVTYDFMSLASDQQRKGMGQQWKKPLLKEWFDNLRNKPHSRMIYYCKIDKCEKTNYMALSLYV